MGEVYWESVYAETRAKARPWEKHFRISLAVFVASVALSFHPKGDILVYVATLSAIYTAVTGFLWRQVWRCPHCSESLVGSTDKSRFCAKCGRKLSGDGRTDVHSNGTPAMQDDLEKKKKLVVVVALASIGLFILSLFILTVRYRAFLLIGSGVGILASVFWLGKCPRCQKAAVMIPHLSRENCCSNCGLWLRLS